MSRLSNLYSALDTLKREGLDTAATEQKIAECEQEIIDGAVLPLLREKLQPLLEQINHEVTLRVSYTPGEPLSVSLGSENPAAEEPAEHDSETFVHEPEPSQADDDKPSANNVEEKGPVSRLRVTFPDGRVVHEQFAKDTMAQVIRIIGPERVAKVVEEKAMNRCGVPLVGKVRHQKGSYKYRQDDLGGGYLLFTNSSTKSKATDLRTISDALSLSLTVEEIETSQH